ncbi:hypothetical protein J2S40_001416 [Nocardioides luteus]|uniref:Endonuclease/exonuclease/phosphatase domain-containing protein n=1 Tax=Nocardioides luteus TaxID=1844 RepID=A0ABQ5T223_9ACTN|nr:hypothetical protein [Nocardioides luteus]MDR7310358.1 hypothetical protein [Nocardioides luteus]GGR53244.1 hypothetical protein GCM10010197_19470 [Nocardioides luteus]GLJ69863.1 hypothetical protein GCM10017579_38990 [Nocardioides luteus]
MAGRWSGAHLAFIEAMNCDVLLLTEVLDAVQIPGMGMHRTARQMAERRAWAAVATARLMHPEPDPHPATALAVIEGIHFASSILPWRSCGDSPVWHGATTAEKTISAVTDIEIAIPDVWGGDWNQELHGPIYTGSRDGKQELLRATTNLQLQVPTADAPHRLDGVSSIDHIAIPRAWTVTDVTAILARNGLSDLSDHSAYVIDVHQPTESTNETAAVAHLWSMRTTAKPYGP